MAREIYVSSLTYGRCFKIVSLPKEEGDEGSESELGSTKLRQGMMMMSADAAFKFTGSTDEGVTAESAEGETVTIPAKTLVVEIPRQGFDRLVERARS